MKEKILDSIIKNALKSGEGIYYLAVSMEEPIKAGIIRGTKGSRIRWVDEVTDSKEELEFASVISGEIGSFTLDKLTEIPKKMIEALSEDISSGKLTKKTQSLVFAYSRLMIQRKARLVS